MLEIRKSETLKKVYYSTKDKTKQSAFDRLKSYSGVLKDKKDAMEIQKEIRNEW